MRTTKPPKRKAKSAQKKEPPEWAPAEWTIHKDFPEARTTLTVILEARWLAEPVEMWARLAHDAVALACADRLRRRAGESVE